MEQRDWLLLGQITAVYVSLLCIVIVFRLVLYSKFQASVKKL